MKENHVVLSNSFLAELASMSSLESRYRALAKCLGVLTDWATEVQILLQ